MVNLRGRSLAKDTQSDMVREILELFVFRPNRASFVLAVTGTLALALLLAGCGRKGSLDPPPGGYVLERDTIRTPISGRGTVRGQEVLPEKDPEYDDQGRPIPPAGPKKRLPADWLLD